MVRILLLSCLLFAACKKDDAKQAAPATAEKKIDGNAAAGAAAPAAQPAKPTAGGVSIASSEEYLAKAVDMTDKVFEMFVAGGTDCDKLAADMSTFVDQHLATMHAIKAFEDAHPEARKAFDDKMAPREKELDATLEPAFEACKDHAGLQTALQKLPL